ncbi:MAG TPA: SusC/RagA family TonB-linked outer membrane protein [Longimicrobiaceae bacterium]|nr:SusC/RagA family TonB-linked outer membrane protein [Longimicrobiaceae bacterium]
MHPRCLRHGLGAALLFAMCWALPAPAQDAPYRLRGTVTDAATQRPLAGVTVALRGTSARTVTNAGGQYTLAARVQPGAYTLVFSQLGRGDATRAVTLGAEREVAVAPVALGESAVALQAIVVTGTGAPVERRQVGNTVATVPGEEIRDAPGARSVDQALQGKIAGALISQNSGQPGAGVSIRLRGTNSIYGGAEPLIVIDGVLVDNNSEALVGLGANAARGSAAISNRLSDISPADIDHVEVLKGAAAAALYGSRANNGVIQVFTRRGRTGAPRVTFHTEAGTSTTTQRLALNMVPLVGTADTIADRTLGPRLGKAIDRFDIQDQLFRTGHMATNELAVSGGSAGTTYYLSGSWNNEAGTLRSTEYDRRTARARVSQQVNGWLELGVNGTYLQTRNDLVPEGEQTQGVFTSVVFTPTYFNPAYDSNLGRYPYNPILGANPLDVIANWRARSNVERFLGSVQAQAKPLSGLTLTYLFGMDSGRQEDTYFQPPFSTGPAFTGSIQNPVRSIRKYNQDITANHELQLSPALGLTSTAGFRYTQDRTSTLAIAASNLPPGQTTVVGATQTASQGINELRTLGGFLQERLSVGDRLFLTAGANMEGSSAFGADQRFQLFPRVSASYELGKEGFFRDGALGHLFSTFRLRAAYGQTGGQPPSNYLNQVTYLNVAYAGIPGLRPNTLAPNPDLKPERQREVEGGFDATFLGSRASLEFSAYDKRTSDLVLSVPLAPTSGFASQWRNIGELSNRGVEVSLSTVNFQRDRFGWQTHLTFAHNRDRIERLNATSDTLVFDYLNAVIKGQPIGVFYGAYYPRDAQGNIQYSATGLPRRARGCPAAGCKTAADSIVLRRVVGDPNPDFTAALGNRFNLGSRVELSFLLDGRFGNDVVNFTRRTSDFFGSSANAGREILGDTLVGTFTRNTERNLLYEEFVEDGSFVKLREVAASYRLDAPWVRRRTGAESISLRVAGRNLHTWTHYSGLDPEINLFAASTVSRGVDFATTPIPRVLSVALDINF